MKLCAWLALCIFLSFSCALTDSAFAAGANNSEMKNGDARSLSFSLTKPVYEEVTRLVKTYYPNAKVSESGGKLHFEYKAAEHNSMITNRPEMGPKMGGIYGEVETKAGRYQSSQPMPRELQDYNYQTVLMAPYSANHDCHLSVRISYPSDASGEFVEKFKTLVREFDSLLPQPPKPIAIDKPASPDLVGADANKTISTAVSAASVAAPLKPAPAARKLFFWKAKRGADVVYLLGTIHTAPPSLYPLPKEIERAFDESKCLVVEVDISKRKVDPAKIEALVATSGKYTPPDKLSKHLSPGTRRVFDAYLNWAGESWEMYDQYKPWYVRELIGASVPRRGDLSKLRKVLGIDLHFLAKAAARKKPVDEFETVEFQLGLDSKLADDVQDKLLQVSLLEIKDTDTMMAGIFDAWKSGDLQKMERTAIHVSADNPELIPFTKALLDNRNVGMAAKIEPFLKTKGSPLFVAVGSAHMVGETGLVNLLKKKGFDVEQVTADGEGAQTKR
jgi:uncharacterized protein YbaP (TraB family)